MPRKLLESGPPMMSVLYSEFSVYLVESGIHSLFTEVSIFRSWNPRILITTDMTSISNAKNGGAFAMKLPSRKKQPIFKLSQCSRSPPHLDDTYEVP